MTLGIDMFSYLYMELGKKMRDLSQRVVSANPISKQSGFGWVYSTLSSVLEKSSLAASR